MPAWPQSLRQHQRMPTAPQRGIDDGLARLRIKQLNDRFRKHGNMDG